jgi:hypothetical protein
MLRPCVDVLERYSGILLFSAGWIQKRKYCDTKPPRLRAIGIKMRADPAAPQRYDVSPDVSLMARGMPKCWFRGTAATPATT